MDLADVVFDINIPLGSPEETTLLGEGQYGKTWKIGYREAPDDTEQWVAIKILKPIPPARPGSNPIKAFADEVRFLRQLRHPGIVRIIRDGTCNVGDEKSYYYMAEYEAGETLNKFPWDPQVGDVSVVVDLAKDLLTTLHYCHSKRVLHLDIKPDNILVSTDTYDGKPKCVLIDFGKAKRIYDAEEEDLTGKFTSVAPVVHKYVHPHLHEYLRRNRAPKELYTAGAERFDLYSIAVVLEDMLPGSETERWLPNSRQYRLVRTLCNALKNSDDDSFFSALHGLEIIQRMPSRSEATEPVKVRLTNLNSVFMDAGIMDLVETEEFQRLRHISQLGMSHLVYPSATHTRFSHSLGAYYFAGEYARFLNNDAYFRFHYSSEDMALLKLMALVHDIGHYPFAHYLEDLESRELPIRLGHRYYTNRMITGEIGWVESGGVPGRFAHLIREITGLDPEEFLNRLEEDTLLHSIIDGPIDCDKLDYLIRDGAACGVPYPRSIDTERFMSSLICTGIDKNPIIGVSPKGVAAVETILLARYHMFSEVYWHKTCRAIASMIRDAMWQLLQTQRVEQEEFNDVVLKKGDYNFLRWVASKLAEVDEQASDDLIGGAFLGKQRRIYKRVLTYSPIWADRRASTTPYEDLVDKCHSYATACKVRDAIVDTLNKKGKSLSGWLDIPKHHVLLDIPPAGKDIQRGIEVGYREDSLDQYEYGLEDVSVFLNKMDTGYLQQTKKIRLFVHPATRKQVESISDFHKRVSDAITGFFKEL